MSSCICTHFNDTDGYRVADLACPTHGVEGTEPGDGYWDPAVATIEELSTNPERWAESFNATINPNVTGWFANAIEAGRRAGYEAGARTVKSEPAPYHTRVTVRDINGAIVGWTEQSVDTTDVTFITTPEQIAVTTESHRVCCGIVGAQSPPPEPTFNVHAEPFIPC
jgi:hypothetical protein